MTNLARRVHIPPTYAQQRQVVRRIDAIERAMIPADFDPHTAAAQQFGQLLTPPDSACTFGECRSTPACKERCPNKPKALPKAAPLPIATPTPQACTNGQSCNQACEEGRACPARQRPPSTDWVRVGQGAAAVAFLWCIAFVWVALS